MQQNYRQPGKVVFNDTAVSTQQHTSEGTIRAAWELYMHHWRLRTHESSQLHSSLSSAYDGTEHIPALLHMAARLDKST